jgi:hypothetical protein
LTRFAKTDRRRRFGRAFDEGATLARKAFQMLMSPMQRACERVSFPTDVADPEAFLVVWQFLFGRFPELRNQFARCEECGTLYSRYRPSQRTCSRRCQLIRYRRKARAERARPPSPAARPRRTARVRLRVRRPKRSR